MSVDRAIALVTLVVGGAAAYFAWRAYRVTLVAGRDASKQRAADTKPVITIHGVLLSQSTVKLINAGGAVSLGYVSVEGQGTRFGGPVRLPAHSGVVDVYVHGIGPISSSRAHSGEVTLLIAQDVDGRWWDALTQTPLLESPPARADEAALEEWVKAKQST